MKIDEVEFKKCGNRLDDKDDKTSGWVCQLPFNHEGKHEASGEDYYPATGEILWQGTLRWP